MKSWKDIRERKFPAEELGEIDQEVEAELLEMDLCVARSRRSDARRVRDRAY